MSTPEGLTRTLSAELAALNDSQRFAAVHPDSLVVRAGPGSGKTRTVVAKAAYALEATIPPRRGLAAITYTRHAAQEIGRRLEMLDVRAGGRLAAGTVHGWCLRHILLPYGPLVGITPPGRGQVIDDRSDEWMTLLQRSIDQQNAGGKAEWQSAAVRRIRRRVAAGIAEDPRDPLVRAAFAAEAGMLERGWYDFDLMVSQALVVLRDNPLVTDLVAARFPWLIVDEYQDLGPVLHRIVTHLHDVGGVQVAAFGDPDQTIMSFTGASPTYLRELVERADFVETTLDINYRCGAAIITASHATVDDERAHQADPLRADPGVVDLVTVRGGLADHAATTVMTIDNLLASGAQAHHIAVLYPRRGPLLDELVSALDASARAYVHEGDLRLPDGDLVQFIRSCAARAVAGPQPIGYPDFDHASAVPTVGELATTYRHLHDDAGRPTPARLQAGRLLAAATDTVPAAIDLAAWLLRLDNTLHLSALAEQSKQKRDRLAIPQLHDAAARFGLSVGDIAGALRTGKVTLTTYHSAKGREWNYVIMPGLVDGIMPMRRWHAQSRQFVRVSLEEYDQDRRAFYVGMTRAKLAVIMIEGDHWLSSWGAPNRYGVSPFARLVRRQLAAQPGPAHRRTQSPALAFADN